MSKATGFHILALLLFVSQLAFAEPRVRYVPTNEIKLANADASSLQILTRRPERRHVVLGRWWGIGDASSTPDSLLMLAREKAAELGADFVLITKKEMVTHQQSGPSGGFGMGFGGRSINSVPLLNATFGVFAKATTGVQYRGAMVAGFSDTSAAPSAGVLVGDEILEIDYVPLSSERMPERILEKTPGQVVKLLIRRGDSTLTIPVPLVAND